MAFNIDIEGTPPTQSELDKIRECWRKKIITLERKFSLYDALKILFFVAFIISLPFVIIAIQHLFGVVLWVIFILGVLTVFGRVIKTYTLNPLYKTEKKLVQLYKFNFEDDDDCEVFMRLNEWGKRNEKIKTYFKAVAKQGRLPIKYEYEKAKAYFEALNHKENIGITAWKELTD